MVSGISSYVVVLIRKSVLVSYIGLYDPSGDSERHHGECGHNQNVAYKELLRIHDICAFYYESGNQQQTHSDDTSPLYR